MKVKEFIEKLKKFDKEKEITIPDIDLQQGDLWKIDSLEERGDNIVIWTKDEKVKIKKEVITEYYENGKLVKRIVKEEEELKEEPKKTMEEIIKEIQDKLDREFPPRTGNIPFNPFQCAVTNHPRESKPIDIYHGSVKIR